MSDKYFPKITAKSSDEFATIEAAIKSLPEQILEQIERVESELIGTTCYFKKLYPSENKKIVLPNNTSQINNYGDYIGVHTDKFFFKIPTSKDDVHFSYLFINH